MKKENKIIKSMELCIDYTYVWFNKSVNYSYLLSKHGIMYRLNSSHYENNCFLDGLS